MPKDEERRLRGDAPKPARCWALWKSEKEKRGPHAEVDLMRKIMRKKGSRRCSIKMGATNKIDFA